jgi:D-glycero-D-manno-heptose 1,7-bisphosphate phosphatase
MHAIFLDRDGVICENRSDHVKTWQEFQFIPGAKSSLVALSKLGLPIIVVTNQAAINRGLASAKVVEEIHNQMVREIEAEGGRIDRVIYCPHRPDEICNCRKPEPGMLLEAAKDLDLDLTRSYMIGDAVTDLVAGQQVGCQTFLVLTGRGSQQLKPAFQSVRRQFMVTRNLLEAAYQIIKIEQYLGNGFRYCTSAEAHRYFSWPPLGTLQAL